MINVTKDYNLFKPFFYNRSLKKRNLEKIKTSMTVDGSLLDLHPIVVTHNYEILDGGHRFQCAKELDIPVHYIKMPEIPLDKLVKTLIALNYNMSKWGGYEFCEIYCKMEKPEYLKFKKFASDFNLECLLAIPASKLRSKRGKLNTRFRDGSFVFEDEEKIREIITNSFEFLEEAVRLGVVKAAGPHKNTKFFDAYGKLMENNDFSQKTMMQQLNNLGIGEFGLVSASCMMIYYNQLNSLYKKPTPKSKKAA